MFKKVSLALVALGLSASAYAGHPAEDVMLPPTVSVTIPQQQGSWNVGVEALYWEISNGDYHYVSTDTSTSTSSGGANLTHETFKSNAVNPEHDWGVRGDVTYHFAGNGRDVTLSYTHLHDNESDRTIRRDGQALTALDIDIFTPNVAALVPPATNEFSANGWDEARGKSDNDYDAVDLVFGQKMDFGQKVTLRAFGGIRYADIDTSDRADYAAEAVNGSSEVLLAVGQTHNVSDFEGVGPRAGMDAQVRLGGNFSIMGTVGGSLLVGDRDQKLDSFSTITNVDQDTSDTFSFSHRISDKTIVVPEMDARIGLNYTHAFSPDTSLGVEVGFEVNHYWNAKDNSYVSYTDSMSHDNDFALHGPYFRLELNLA